MRRTILWLPGALAIVAALCPTGRALAKSDGSWKLTYIYEERWRFDAPTQVIPPLEIDRLARDLSLSDAQHAALTNLLSGAQRQCDGAWIELAEKVDDLDDWDDPEADWQHSRREVRALCVDAGRLLAQTRAHLLADLEIILTEEQRTSWDQAMRAHRRRMNLARYACLEGESIDLVSIIGLLDPPPAPDQALDRLLETYASEMDSALRARSAAHRNLDAVCVRIGKAENEDEPDEDAIEKLNEEALDLAERCLDASRRLQDINQRYLDSLLPLLSPEAKEQAMTLVGHSSEVKVDFYEPRGLRVLRCAEHLDAAATVQLSVGLYDRTDWASLRASAARDVEPLTREQHAKIVALREEYEREHARLRREHNLKGDDRSADYRQIRCDMGFVVLQRVAPDQADSETAEDKYDAFQRDVVALSRKFIARVRALLTVRQRILLQSLE